MRGSRILALAVFSWCASPALANADWLVTPFIGLKFSGNINTPLDLEQGADDTKLTIGGSGAILSDGLLGVEVDFGYSPRFFESAEGINLIARSNVTTLTGNVIVATPVSVTREALRPYAVGGLGLIHIGIDDVLNVVDVSSNLLGVNIGGGAIGALTNRTSVRFELRYFRNVTSDPPTPTGTTRFSFWRTTVGVVVKP